MYLPPSIVGFNDLHLQNYYVLCSRQVLYSLLVKVKQGSTSNRRYFCSYICTIVLTICKKICHSIIEIHALVCPSSLLSNKKSTSVHISGVGC